jgi:hypothetical protein
MLTSQVATSSREVGVHNTDEMRNVPLDAKRARNEVEDAYPIAVVCCGFEEYSPS